MPLVQRLVEQYGADKNAETNIKQTPLAVSICAGQATIQSYLESVLGLDDGSVSLPDDESISVSMSAFDDGDLDSIIACNEEKEKSIWRAIQKGDLALVRQSVDADDEDVIQVCCIVDSKSGETPLHLSCGMGSLEIARYLLEECKLDIEATDHFGRTALHLASRENRVDVVKFLLEWTVSGSSNGIIDAKDSNGFTALHYASSNGHLLVVRLLVEEFNADTRVLDSNGRTPMELASCQKDLTVVSYFNARFGNIDSIQTYMMNRRPSLDSTQDNSARKIDLDLRHAIEAHDIGRVRKLLELRGADLNATDENGWTSLHIACKTGSIDIAQCLVLECGADVEAVSRDGMTALHFACSGDSISLTKWLVEVVGADVGATTKYGWTALHYACYNRSMDITRFLIETGRFNVEARTQVGRTALHLAAQSGNELIARFLVLKCKANIEATDFKGWTALCFACSHVDECTQPINRDAKLRLVKQFVEEYGANIHVVDNEGLSVAKIAKRHRSGKAASYLQARLKMTGGCQPELCRTVVAPPGKLGVSFDSTAEGPVVGEVLPSGAMDRLLFPGDRIISVDDIDTRFMTSSEITSLVVRLSDKRRTFMVLASSCQLVESDSGKSMFSPGTLHESLTFTQVTELFQAQNKRVDKILSSFGEGTPMCVSQEQQDVLLLMIGEACQSQEEEEEKQAILASRQHSSFYLLLARKLFCMIHAFEVLSTGMLAHRNGDSMRSFVTQLLTEDSISECFVGIRIGAILSDILGWGKKNLSPVPFLDSASSICQLFLALKDERDRYMGIARVADFAALVSVQQSNDGGLRSTVERFARIIVRARVGMPNMPFIEKCDKFGKFKQYALNMLMEPGNTPAKEQACKTADCCFANLMKPSMGSVLHSLLHEPIANRNVAFHEVLAAATLETTIEEIQQLDMFRQFNNLANGGLPSATSGAYSGEINVSPSSTTAACDLQPLLNVSDEIETLRREMNALKKSIKKQQQQRPDVDLDAGGGLVYADHRERYQDMVNNLASQGMDHKEQLCLLLEACEQSREERDRMNARIEQIEDALQAIVARTSK